MKILYITTIGGTMDFFKSLIKQLIDEGHTVDIATNETDSKVSACYQEWGCTIHGINTSRSPFDKGNFKAIKQIKELVTQKKYDIVHCHTPIAAMCTRFACRKARKSGTKVMYTAHGFHFFKGAPLFNWVCFFPIEWLCALWTDVLITINKEDYELAIRKMRCPKVEYVPGVGIDIEKFTNMKIDKSEKRRELGIPKNVELLLSVGELNENKNHELVIKAISKMKDVHYIIAGEGEQREYLQNLIDELSISDRVKLLGYRTDIRELCNVADVFVMPSFREGLPVSVMEAMASGLPVLCSRIRGNSDLIDEKGGILFNPNNVMECREAIDSILRNDKALYGKYNLDKAQKLSVEAINTKMIKIYFSEE